MPSWNGKGELGMVQPPTVEPAYYVLVEPTQEEWDDYPERAPRDCYDCYADGECQGKEEPAHRGADGKCVYAGLNSDADKWNWLPAAHRLDKFCYGCKAPTAAFYCADCAKKVEW